MRNVLAFGAGAGGALAIAAGAAFVTTSVTVAVGRSIISARKKKTGITCGVCSGERRVSCKLCKGKAVIDWSPFPNAMVKRYCLCPTCGGKQLQKCLNCLGKGYV
ncbi:hypothetical protein CYMTET_19367 [Cymbomonas tetramitiformis]|uniref:Uncharacterized protein n=1 Tax=Cymbomonas tetramitiformis TaxID=36881 RepID=A0AAE0G6S2_9CHLO|nr:hypothetical protein CYMTET_19367 [Cymbomonas tetramitiformis]